MCPTCSIIRPETTAASVNPAKKPLSTRPESVGSKSAAATRREKKVPKKPLASCTKLVATMRVPICARIVKILVWGLSNGQDRARPPEHDRLWEIRRAWQFIDCNLQFLS